MTNIHEEEKLGKAYDARLLRRLVQYLRPYKWRVVLALTFVAIVTPLELAPPWLFWRAIDRYFTPTLKHIIPESLAWRGIEWISLAYLAILISDFLAQYAQISIMQRVGQQTMYDLRREIFAHIQRLSMTYFDRNPVGRLITRVTTDVDALNDLFAAGVVTMVNDFFLLVVMAAFFFTKTTIWLSMPSPFFPLSLSSPISSASTSATPTATSALPSRVLTLFFRNIFPA